MFLRLCSTRRSPFAIRLTARSATFLRRACPRPGSQKYVNPTPRPAPIVTERPAIQYSRLSNDLDLRFPNTAPSSEHTYHTDAIASCNKLADVRQPWRVDLSEPLRP